MEIWKWSLPVFAVQITSECFPVVTSDRQSEIASRKNQGSVNHILDFKHFFTNLRSWGLLQCLPNLGIIEPSTLAAATELALSLWASLSLMRLGGNYWVSWLDGPCCTSLALLDLMARWGLLPHCSSGF
ncbi:hypothetical protein ElyMa_006008400 [Elysia marginata]|uniref:Uncharacterized protein n=1 Tax=Elysia marginata TaxID=1093978 RepID=A0AAV4GI34_9GAST|nr:hypothetical protein ElyMa_006008400 [Elysia marginata]